MSRALFRLHAGRRRRVRGEIIGVASNLSDAQRATIDGVLEYYGTLGAETLVELSHRERPWIAARGSLAPRAMSSTPIDAQTLRTYFERLADGSHDKRIPEDVRHGIVMALELSEDEIGDGDDEGDLAGTDAERWLATVCQPES